MNTHHAHAGPRTVRPALLTAAAFVVLTLAACTGSATAPAPAAAPASDVQVTSGEGQPDPASTASPTAPGPVEPATSVRVSASSSPLGTTVVDRNGNTLYRFDEDTAHPSTTRCSGPCATTWPPVTVQHGGQVLVDSVDSHVVGTVRRADGSLQVTIGGWPVYRFAGDTAPGQTNGQGVKGTWFAVAPTGAKTSSEPRQGAAPVAAVDPHRDRTDATKVSLSVTKSASGTVITDGSGQTVYVSGRDGHAPARSACDRSSDCGTYRPVPAAKAKQSLHVPGVTRRDVGSLESSDRPAQMTLFGYPLYTSSSDDSPGDTRGEDPDGGWFALGLDDDR